MRMTDQDHAVNIPQLNGNTQSEAEHHAIAETKEIDYKKATIILNPDGNHPRAKSSLQRHYPQQNSLFPLPTSHISQPSQTPIMKLPLLTTPVILLTSLPLTLAQGPGNRPGLCYPESCGYALVNSGSMSPLLPPSTFPSTPPLHTSISYDHTNSKHLRLHPKRHRKAKMRP